MAKLKELIAVVLALTVMIAGAYFPRAVSFFLDWSNNGAASSNPISSIRIELNKNIPSLGKLAILSKLGSNIELSQSKAKMTREEVLDAVHKGIQPYLDAQLMAYSEMDIQMYPSLIQSKDEPALQSIAWIVEITGDPSDFTFLQMIIDDETGCILMISFTHEKLQGLLAGTEALSAFADIYFTAMGLDQYAQFLVPDLEYAYVGDNANAVRYRFGDAVYGEVNVDLYVHEHGFYIEFPDIINGSYS